MYTCTLNVPPLSLTYSILWSIEDRPTIKVGFCLIVITLYYHVNQCLPCIGW